MHPVKSPLLFVLFAALTAFSCSDRAVGSADKPASASVGSSGGTVTTSGGTAISIPAGALESPVTIGITPVEQAVPGITKLSQVYRFTPAGQTFAKPATVSIKLNTATGKAPLLYWTKKGRRKPV